MIDIINILTKNQYALYAYTVIAFINFITLLTLATKYQQLFNIGHRIGFVFMGLGFFNKTLKNLEVIGTIDHIWLMKIPDVLSIDLISIGVLIITLSYIVKYFYIRKLNK